MYVAACSCRKSWQTPEKEMTWELLTAHLIENSDWTVHDSP